MERFLENAMYASRWLLAPVYFGLSLALVALALKFFQEIIHVLPNIFSMAESDLILVLLSLVDMTLVGGLLVMVMFSGYENFVSQLDISENKEKFYRGMDNRQSDWGVNERYLFAGGIERLAQQHVVYPRAVVAGWCDVGTAQLCR